MLVHIRSSTSSKLCRKEDSTVWQKAGCRRQKVCLSCGAATDTDAAKLIAETGLQLLGQLDHYLPKTDCLSACPSISTGDILTLLGQT